METQIEPYRARSTRFLELADHGDWRIKLYSICTDSEVVPDELVEAATRATLPFLPKPAVTDERYGVGFLTIHRGSDANWMLLDWWESDCILCHRLFRSSFSSPARITEVEYGHLMACTYEMVVQQFERQAWIDTVMGHGLSQGVPRYLDRVLEP